MNAAHMDDLSTFYESKGDVILWPQNVDVL